MNPKAAFFAVILTVGICFYGLYLAFEAESVDDLVEKLEEVSDAESTSGESPNSHVHFNCFHSAGSLAPVSTSDFPQVTFEEVELFVQEILSIAGLEPNFEIDQTSDRNCYAKIEGDDRYISVNPLFFGYIKHQAQTDWAIKGILAHEIGHHLNGHTLDSIGSKPYTELEADKYSGNILAKMGARLEEAQSFFLINNLHPTEASDTHPSLSDRLKAVEEGWNAGRKIFDTTSYSRTEEFVEQVKVQDLEYLRSLNHSSQSWEMERPGFLQKTARFDPFYYVSRAAKFERGLENSRQELYSLYEPLMQKWREENPDHHKSKIGVWSDSDKRRWISWLHLKKYAHSP